MVEMIGMPAPIDPLKGVERAQPAGSQPTEGAKSFADFLAEKIEEVNDLQLNAAEATKNLYTGKTDDLVDVVLAARKADVVFKALMEIRNRMVDAYQEIIRARG